MATFQLELVTPEKVVFSETVKSVRAPGIQGSFGVLANHSPMMTALSVGLIKVTYDNGLEEYVATSGGFIEVRKDKVIILADTAERADDIDVKRVEAAIAREKASLAGGDVVDYEEARRNLERASNRLKIAQMTGNRQ